MESILMKIPKYAMDLSFQTAILLYLDKTELKKV